MRKEDLFPDLTPADPAHRIRAAVTRIRSLRGQVGHDGLTPSGTRTLIDELTAALEEIARALDRDRP
jgi:hypothetical protein